MAEPRPPLPVLLVVAAFSRHADALAGARQLLERAFGPVGLAGEPYPFDQTAYYGPTMGLDLRKQLLAFRDLVAPELLAEVKMRTNALERELPSAGAWPEPRPLNLDPGLLALGKFLLATTKGLQGRVAHHGVEDGGVALSRCCGPPRQKAASLSTDRVIQKPQEGGGRIE
jgi:hypothetical protein